VQLRRAVVPRSRPDPEIAADLGVVGLSHRTSPIQRFAEIAPPAEERRALARTLVSDGMDEALVLTTCNRVEVVFAKAPRAPADEWVGAVCRRLGPRAEEAHDAFFACSGRAALRHLLELAASLDSLVVGERQVLRQLREAVLDAEVVGTLGPRLRTWTAEAFRAARCVRRETRLVRGASVASLAVERLIDARERFPHAVTATASAPVPIALIGAGAVVEHAALLLSKTPAGPRGVSLLLVNRTLERAQALARRFGGTALPLDRFLAEPPAVGAVLVATSAPHPILGRAELDRLAGARCATSPLLLLDLAVPFNVDASARERRDVQLVTIDELRAEAARRAEMAAGEIEKARAVVARRIEQLEERAAERARGLCLARARNLGEEAAARCVDALVREHPEISAPVRERLVRWAVEASHRLAHASWRREDRDGLLDVEERRGRAVLAFAPQVEPAWSARAAAQIALAVALAP
jgi:glutamyl-tRNA reductase